MRTAASVAAAWVAAVASIAAGATPNLRYAKAIATPGLDKEDLVAVELDSDVFAATRDGLPDVRIRDAAGRETAFVVRPMMEARPARMRKTWTARDPQVKLLDGDGLEITLTLQDSDQQPYGLRLVTPLRNFEQNVQVFSSVDGNEWTPVVENGLIFDYSQFMDVRNDALEFPADARSPARHWRIVIDDVTKEQQSQLMELTRRLRGDDETDRSERIAIVRQPFRIDRIEFWSEQQASGPRRVSYPLDSSPAREDDEHRQTIVAAASRREPLTAVRLATEDRNFSRTARVEVQRNGRDGVAWEPIGQATVSRLDFRDLQRENLEIPIPETREPSLRVVIENRDSAPLNITGLEGLGPAYEAVFLADPAEEYRLAYGSPTAEAPHYDAAAITASLAADYRPVAAELGDQTELSPAEAAPTEPLLARLLANPIFVTVVIALLVTLLAFGLYSASRRVDDLPQ